MSTIQGQADFGFSRPMASSAVLSDCGLYRYTLTRQWGEGDKINFLMLNPSTADATIDDPTITRCIIRAKRLGFGSLVVTNLFAFRATDPAAMKAASDPVGLENDKWIKDEATLASRVVCAWGTHGEFGGRAKQVLRMLAEIGAQPHCLKVTKDGHPGHPLYVPMANIPYPMPGAIQ